MEESPEKTWSFHLPGWVRDVAMKLLPWAIMGIIGASVGLYIDNIGNKRDIERNSWRNDQQDVQIAKCMDRLDRIEEHSSNEQEVNSDFRGTVLEYLQKILKVKR